MEKRQRKSIEQRIKEYQEKLNKLKEKQRRGSGLGYISLDKDSVGIGDAITALNRVAEANKTSMGDVIKCISRIKRTGLRIQDPMKKARKKPVQSAAGVEQQ